MDQHYWIRTRTNLSLLSMNFLPLPATEWSEVTAILGNPHSKDTKPIYKENSSISEDFLSSLPPKFVGISKLIVKIIKPRDSDK
jgi:hypothetical protein